MWQKTFAERLTEWAELRSRCEALPPVEALHTIVEWWHHSPWQPYYLHWDDLSKWPDPWQLLADNVYCTVAKSLGIVYTITMMNHVDLTTAELVQTEDNDDLVLVNGGKYVINMIASPVVNTNSAVKIKRKISQQQLQQYK